MCWPHVYVSGRFWNVLGVDLGPPRRDASMGLNTEEATERRVRRPAVRGPGARPETCSPAVLRTGEDDRPRSHVLLAVQAQPCASHPGSDLNHTGRRYHARLLVGVQYHPPQWLREHLGGGSGSQEPPRLGSSRCPGVLSYSFPHTAHTMGSTNHGFLVPAPNGKMLRNLEMKAQHPFSSQPSA